MTTLRRLAPVLLLVAALPLVGQVQADPKVKELLEDLKVKYKVLESGAYMATLSLGDKRTQLVRIESKLEKLGDIEVREITAPVALYDGPVPPEVATKLLDATWKLKLGSFAIINDGNKNMVIFDLKLPANSDRQVWRTGILMAAVTADKWELELTGQDRF